MQADKLEKLRERMVKVRELFRDTESTEFVIVTIPTVISLSWFLLQKALINMIHNLQLRLFNFFVDRRLWRSVSHLGCMPL